MFDSIKRALGGDSTNRQSEILEELTRVREAQDTRRQQLIDKRSSRLQALFPEGPVEGFSAGRYPGLAPLNFEEDEQQPWMVAAATGIIDNFPGSDAMLVRLDATFRGFADANHYRVVEGGPYAEHLTWQNEIFSCWDLEGDVPIYISSGAACGILCYQEPIVVLGRMTLDVLDQEEQRFLLAARLGHVFFGNLKIFQFYRLMEMFDKLPSMTSLITRGIGMIPGVGNTISRGIELARSLNNEVIRKTNLVVGQRQHVLCDRLASLALGTTDVAQRFYAKAALGGEHCLGPGVRERLIEQGREVRERFERGEIDLSMLSVVGPDNEFAALRAFKLDEWERGEQSKKIAGGYYVTHSRLREYQRSNKALEDEIRFVENRLLELHKKEDKLNEELNRLLTAEVEESA